MWKVYIGGELVKHVHIKATSSLNRLDEFEVVLVNNSENRSKVETGKLVEIYCGDFLILKGRITAFNLPMML